MFDRFCRRMGWLLSLLATEVATLLLQSFGRALRHRRSKASVAPLFSDTFLLGHGTGRRCCFHTQACLTILKGHTTRLRDFIRRSLRVRRGGCVVRTIDILTVDARRPMHCAKTTSTRETPIQLMRYSPFPSWQLHLRRLSLSALQSLF